MANFKKDFDYLIGSLSIFEQQLVTELYPAVKRIVENFTLSAVAYSEWSRYDTDSAHARTISDYKEKIDRVVKLLDSSDQKLEEFLKHFPSWKRKRKQNIEDLREIAEITVTIRKISSIVKITAGYVGVIGGMAIIGSVLLRSSEPALLLDTEGGEIVSSESLRAVLLPAARNVCPLAVVGGTLTSIRALVSTAASFMDLVFIELMLNEARNVIEGDHELLEQLGVFEFFDQLNDAIDDLLSIRTANGILGDLIDFFKKVPPISDGIEYLQPDALHRCLYSILPNMTEFLLIGTSLASAILTILLVSFLIRRRICPILNHRLTIDLVNAVDTSMEITNLFSSGLKVFKLGKWIPQNLAAKITVCTIAGIRIALDRASINKNFIDLAKLKRAVATHSTAVVVNPIPCDVGHQTSVQLIFPEARICFAPQTSLDGNHCQSCLCTSPGLPPKKVGPGGKLLYGSACCLLLLYIRFTF